MLPHLQSNRNSAVSTRTNAQTSRQGWRPRATSPSALAQDIVASIEDHQAQGDVRSPEDYTTDPAILRQVRERLSETPPVDLQQAAVAATQQVQQQYDGAIDSERLSKALDLVLARAVQTHLDGSATVRSGSHAYTVASGACTCADFQHRTHLCKHMLAVEIHARTATLLSHPPALDDADDEPQAVSELSAHWSRHEPPLLYTGKFHDPELGIEHLICVRCDTFPELWNGVREVTRMVKAKREQHTPDDTATPPSEDTPACTYHGPMRPSIKAPGQWYCPSKMGDGSYCKERWPREVRR